MFCPRCGAPLSERIPELDDRPRKVCSECAFVVYVNPKVAAGTVPVRDDGQIALVRRAVEPQVGLWSWPCGYLENDETVEDCARRETHEETGVEVLLGALLGIYSYPQDARDATLAGSGLVIVSWAARVTSIELAPGSDVQETAWFAPADIPWDELAFDSSHRALRDFLDGTRDFDGTA